MQKLVIIGIIIIVVMATYAVLGSQSQRNLETQNSELKWNTDLNLAIGEAKKTQKPIFIYFHAPWCYYCNELDENTFSDPQVQEKLANNYILVKIDIDENQQLASDYKIYGVPTLVILNQEGTEIKRKGSYVNPDELLSQL